MPLLLRDISRCKSPFPVSFLIFGILTNTKQKDAYIGHLKDFHKVDWERYQAFQGNHRPTLPLCSGQESGSRRETIPINAAKSDINARFTPELSGQTPGPGVPGDSDEVIQSATLVAGLTHDRDEFDLGSDLVTRPTGHKKLYLSGQPKTGEDVNGKYDTTVPLVSIVVRELHCSHW